MKRPSNKIAIGIISTILWVMLMVSIFLSTMSCSSSSKYTYYTNSMRISEGKESCPVFESAKPIKRKTYKRYASWRHQ